MMPPAGRATSGRTRIGPEVVQDAAVREDPIRIPHPTRLSPAHPRRAEILAAHDAAIEQRRIGYVDPQTGYQVFTAAYLLARGTCCHSGCRHCPYVGTDAG